MDFRAEQHFDVPADVLIARFADPDLYPTLVGLPKISAPEVLSHAASGSTVRLRLRQGYTGDLPGAALAFIDPNKLTWVEELEFDLDQATATTRLVPDHYPDRLQCDGVYVFLTDGPDRSIRRLDGQLKVRAPLVGGRVEKALVQGLQEHAAAERDLIEWELDGG
jgi:hypothetical protein